MTPWYQRAHYSFFMFCQSAALHQNLQLLKGVQLCICVFACMYYGASPRHQTTKKTTTKKRRRWQTNAATPRPTRWERAVFICLFVFVTNQIAQVARVVIRSRYRDILSTNMQLPPALLRKRPSCIPDPRASLLPPRPRWSLQPVFVSFGVTLWCCAVGAMCVTGYDCGSFTENRRAEGPCREVNAAFSTYRRSAQGNFVDWCGLQVCNLIG